MSQHSTYLPLQLPSTSISPRVRVECECLRVSSDSALERQCFPRTLFPMHPGVPQQKCRPNPLALCPVAGQGLAESQTLTHPHHPRPVTSPDSRLQCSPVQTGQLEISMTTTRPFPFFCPFHQTHSTAQHNTAEHAAAARIPAQPSATKRPSTR